MDELELRRLGYERVYCAEIDRMSRKILALFIILIYMIVVVVL